MIYPTEPQTATGQTQVDKSQLNLPSPVGSKKITLVKAVVIATLAIAVIALLYLEVKYRLVSTGIVYAMANPWIIGVVGLVAVVGIAYLIYCSSTQPSTPIKEKKPSRINTPATEEELNRALEDSPYLQNVFLSDFTPYREGARETTLTISTLDEAISKVNQFTIKAENHLADMQNLDPATARFHSLTPAQRIESAQERLDDINAKRGLAIRWLIGPHCQRPRN